MMLYLVKKLEFVVNMFPSVDGNTCSVYAGSGWCYGIVPPVSATRDDSGDCCAQGSRSTDDDESTLTLKPMNRVIRSPK